MKCKKLTYRNLNPESKNNIILGIIIEEDEHFLLFRTANRKLTISKSLILSIEDTNEEFRGYGR
jgi:hypothetical protein